MIAARTDFPRALILDGEGPVGKELASKLVERGAEVHLFIKGDPADPRSSDQPTDDRPQEETSSFDVMEKVFDEVWRRVGGLDLLIKCPKPLPTFFGDRRGNEANRLQWMERELLTLVNFLQLGKRRLTERGGTLLAASHLLAGRSDSEALSESIEAGGVAGTVVSAAVAGGREEVRTLLFTLHEARCEALVREGVAGFWEQEGMDLQDASRSSDPAFTAERLLDLLDQSQNWIADRTIEAFYRKEVQP